MSIIFNPALLAPTLATARGVAHQITLWLMYYS